MIVDMKGELVVVLKQAIKKLFNIETDPVLTRPDEQFGDYSTNVALQLAAKLNRPSKEIAQQLVDYLSKTDAIEKIKSAGPGFINISVSDSSLLDSISEVLDTARPLEGQEILVEFGDPNPFKEMHIGHLYSYIVGDSICRLLEEVGANVRRLSYHGDVGLHVSKALWAMSNAQVDPAKNPDIDIGELYSQGAQAYDENEQARAEIDELNKHVYDKTDQQINNLHEWGVKKSFEYFEALLARLAIKNDKKYLESQTAEAGIEAVKNNLETVFATSNGAVIYEGEKAGLHTRVFITSKGLPTYETKDLGLALLKNRDYPSASRSIIITANEQSEYFKVMLAALAEIEAGIAGKTSHIAHGFVSLSTGKMSSRTGSVFSADQLLTQVKSVAAKKYHGENEETVLAAVKYGFLKHRLGGDITYDVEESLSIEGNSGPYLQYAHARACSILAKSNNNQASQSETAQGQVLEQAERTLARKLSMYPEVVETATAELLPHHIANYLYELAQIFNRFYEGSRIIGDEREALRLTLVNNYKQVLAHGLGLLNISAPERI